MSDPYDLRRFLDAQERSIEIALAELGAGAKHGHWMWFIFPQLAGLGRSETAQFYAIGSIDEARAYLANTLLASRMRRCIETLLSWAGKRSAQQIFGPVDALKLRSSLTLFQKADPSGPFGNALEVFYEGRPDERTLALLNAQA